VERSPAHFSEICSSYVGCLSARQPGLFEGIHARSAPTSFMCKLIEIECAVREAVSQRHSMQALRPWELDERGFLSRLSARQKAVRIRSILSHLGTSCRWLLGVSLALSRPKSLTSADYGKEARPLERSLVSSTTFIEHICLARCSSKKH
jgi:hypothetical protein